MRYISLPGLELKCSQIVLGTSAFTPERKQAVFGILDAYREAGGNVLDTSRIYGAGKSEAVLAMWLQERHNRQEMIVINKGCHHFVDEQGRHYPEKHRVKPEIITADLKESLERMNLDYFDIYLLHRDDQEVPVADLMDVLELHRREGRIKTYGVSNWSTARIAAANEYAAGKGYSGIVVNSPSLSLAVINEPRWEGCTYVDRAYARWHEERQLALFSWASQASGFFTGLYTRDHCPNPDIARVYYNETNWERLERARSLAKQKGDAITANHIALAYVLQQPFPTGAVIGPQTPGELIDSLTALDIDLSEQERIWLEFNC
ncbi:MAG: aldo/keto reductase [Negativicutes bacterium]|nr:aldo/keto reductase [Negativicutes bacterium]